MIVESNLRLNRRSDLRGRRFGMLTALEPTGERKNGYLVWRCVCDCGTEITAASRYLRNGWRSSCGCAPKPKRYRDLTGQRFGKLVVLHVSAVTMPDGSVQEARSENGRVMWDCRCDCGNTVSVIGSQLVGGYRRSCNCLSRPQRKDWVGKQFGHLTVTAYAGKRNGVHYWQCQCDCGRASVVSQSNLQTSHTTSCGCMIMPSRARHLIEGTCIEMIRSKKPFSTNTSGYRGVYPLRQSGKWAAQIMFKGKKRYLGSFGTVEEAAAVRREAEHVYEEFLRRYDAGELACSY